MVKKIINDRQRARKVYGFVQRLPDPVSIGVNAAEGDISVLNLDWKESVRFASTGSVALPPVNSLQAIDGTMNTLNNGDRILLKNQTTSSENGIYIVEGSLWNRTADAIPGSSLTCGAIVYVEDGSYNEGYKWILATKNVTLGGSQTWVLFDRGNDWIVSGSGGQMKTSDPVSIGADYPSTIASDVFFYVSGSRAAISSGPSPDHDITVFAGDVVISGSLNMTHSDGFNGDMLEVSGSLKVTTGSFYLQKAGTNDYYYFANSFDGVTFQSGSAYHTGSLAQGYKSEAIGLASMAAGLLSKATKFAQYSQASSGFSTNYVDNGMMTPALGKAQYSRVVWCGEADTSADQLLFKGYDDNGTLTQFFDLEDDKSYYVKVTAAISDTGNQVDSSTFVREALIYKSGGISTRLSINSTLSLPNMNTYDLDIVVSGAMGNSDMAVVIDPIVPPFGTVGVLKGTATIELTEIQTT